MCVVSYVLLVDDVFVDEAKRGSIVTFKVSDRIRPSDKLYKLVEEEA